MVTFDTATRIDALRWSIRETIRLIHASQNPTRQRMLRVALAEYRAELARLTTED